MLFRSIKGYLSLLHGKESKVTGRR